MTVDFDRDQILLTLSLDEPEDIWSSAEELEQDLPAHGYGSFESLAEAN